MLSQHYTQSLSDPCIYTRRSHGQYVIVIIFVDDLLMITNSPPLRDSFVKPLKNMFTVHDLGHVRTYLGLSISYNKKERTLSINQEPMILRLLEKFNMHNSSPNKTPLTDSTLKELQALKQTQPPSHGPDTTEFPIREAVGSILYLANCSRPDLSVAASKLSQFVSYTSSPVVWRAVKQTLRYLVGTSSLALVYSFKTAPSTPLKLESYCDATWADCTPLHLRIRPLHSRSTLRLELQEASFSGPVFGGGRIRRSLFFLL